MTQNNSAKSVRVSDLLRPGRENAITRRELEGLTGLDGRVIRQMIRVERLSKVPICEDNASGYYIAATTTERDHFVRSMRHRAEEIMRAADAVSEAVIP